MFISRYFGRNVRFYSTLVLIKKKFDKNCPLKMLCDLKRCLTGFQNTSSKVFRCASYFQLCSECLEMCLNTRSWVFDVLHTKPYKIFTSLFKMLNARSMQLDRLWSIFNFPKGVFKYF